MENKRNEELDRLKKAEEMHRHAQYIDINLGFDKEEFETILRAFELAIASLEKSDGCPRCTEQSCGTCRNGRFDDDYCLTAELFIDDEEAKTCKLYVRENYPYCEMCGRKLEIVEKSDGNSH